MPKKTRITLTKKEDLEAVDMDLDSAMERITEANQRVGSLLSSLDEPEGPDEGESGTPEGDEGGSPDWAGAGEPTSQS